MKPVLSVRRRKYRSREMVSACGRFRWRFHAHCWTCDGAHPHVYAYLGRYNTFPFVCLCQNCGRLVVEWGGVRVLTYPPAVPA